MRSSWRLMASIVFHPGIPLNSIPDLYAWMVSMVPGWMVCLCATFCASEWHSNYHFDHATNQSTWRFLRSIDRDSSPNAVHHLLEILFFWLLWFYTKYKTIKSSRLTVFCHHYRSSVTSRLDINHNTWIRFGKVDQVRFKEVPVAKEKSRLNSIHKVLDITCKVTAFLC